MPKWLLMILTLGLATVSCSRGVSRVQTRVLPVANPTTFTFPMPLEEVHTAALQAFSIERQVKQPIFGRSDPASNLEHILSAECSTNAVFAATLFQDPANAHDIYLHTFHTPFVLSAVYRGKKGGLPFIAAFHLHLTFHWLEYDSHCEGLGYRGYQRHEVWFRPMRAGAGVELRESQADDCRGVFSSSISRRLPEGPKHAAGRFADRMRFRISSVTVPSP
jgi:hypothetical protein